MYEIKLIDGGNGFVKKQSSGAFNLQFLINGKKTNLGTFPTQELVEEARQYFINGCNYDLDKYKESKYWLELKNVGPHSENYVKQGTIQKQPSGSFSLLFFINGKRMSLGNFPTQELAEKARQYFINGCNYDLDKYKESKYWLELKNVGPHSENYVKQGTIQKGPSGSFSPVFLINGKGMSLGTFPTQELAEEARQYFINGCNYDLDKYKESKYWLELKNVGPRSENYVQQGTIQKQPSGAFKLEFLINGKKTNLGFFPTQELVEEARQYFINGCNYDLDKYKESKYWLEKTDRRNVSKSYWEKGKLNKRNTSGVNGVRYDKKNKRWVANIKINNKTTIKYFHSFENAVEFRNYLTQLGNEFNADWDEKRKEEQMQFIKEQANLKTKELRSNEKEKEAIKELKEQGEEVDMNYEEDTSTWDSKRKGKKNIKKYNVGDKVNLKSGKVGVIEDYDDNYYYIKDNNCNVIKVKKIKDLKNK